MDRDERRQHRRRQLSWPIWVSQDKGTTIQGLTQDISRGGTYVMARSVPPMEPGTVVSVKIGVPQKDSGSFVLQTVSGRARVVRLDANPSSDGETGIALHFAQDLEPFEGD